MLLVYGQTVNYQAITRNVRIIFGILGLLVGAFLAVFIGDVLGDGEWDSAILMLVTVPAGLVLGLLFGINRARAP